MMSISQVNQEPVGLKAVFSIFSSSSRVWSCWLEGPGNDPGMHHPQNNAEASRRKA
jgi:hypothetical protein